MYRVQNNGNIKQRLMGLKFCIMLFALVAVTIFYIDYNREKFQSINDLAFIRGPFEKYSFTHFGRTADFTLKLHNHINVFRLNTDYVGFMNLDQFKKISRGDIISLGILPSQSLNVNSNNPIFVYSIWGDNGVYLSARDSARVYNRHLLRYMAYAFAACAWLSFFLFLRLSKSRKF